MSPRDRQIRGRLDAVRVEPVSRRAWLEFDEHAPSDMAWLLARHDGHAKRCPVNETPRQRILDRLGAYARVLADNALDEDAAAIGHRILTLLDGAP